MSIDILDEWARYQRIERMIRARAEFIPSTGPGHSLIEKGGCSACKAGDRKNHELSYQARLKIAEEKLGLRPRRNR